MCSVFADLDALEQSDVLRGVSVHEIMLSNVRTADPDDDAIDAGRVILEGKIGCLPVVTDGDRLVGIITEADFVELAVAYLEQTRVDAAEADANEDEDSQDDGQW